MPTSPIDPIDVEPFTTALRVLQEDLFNYSLRWDDPAALACYHTADAALDVARQLLAGTLAPSTAVMKALTAALLDETPLPWVAPDTAQMYYLPGIQTS